MEGSSASSRASVTHQCLRRGTPPHRIRRTLREDELITDLSAGICPVCGYLLREPPWRDGLPSDEICPSCGIQFGYDDSLPARRAQTYTEWRRRWVANGMAWWSEHQDPPPGWDPEQQLERLTSARRESE